jgi:endonuclease/exonuclease/phosphatase family metal-dependent hydrolase
MPFIFLQLYQFQNIAAFNAKTGLKTVESLSIIIFSNLAALIFVYIIKIRKLRIFLVVLSAIIFVLAFWPEIKGLAYVFQIILGNIAGWCLIFMAVERTVINPGQKTPWKTTSALALSGILLFIFAFTYYGSYDLNLPLESWMIVAFATTIIAILGLVSAFLGSSYRDSVSDEMSSRSDLSVNKKPECLKNNLLKYIAVFLLLSLFIVPVIIGLPVKNRAETRTQKDQVRLMHYNIHQGFNIDGYQDLESIARVIEKNDADIICLNEVSRGWVINGSADNYTWLIDRLKMDYAIFMPASDLVWGNAVLSRYPLELIKSGFLPGMDAPLRRSYIYANVDLSDLGIENINIISTHLHQIEGEGEKRKAQVEFLLEEWDSTGRTAICGDFNAVTEDEEIQMMADAGLIDSQLELGKQDELTWVHYKPYRRIDYIWVTPDLEVSDLLVTFSKASDHLPISLLAK